MRKYYNRKKKVVMYATIRIAHTNTTNAKLDNPSQTTNEYKYSHRQKYSNIKKKRISISFQK